MNRYVKYCFILSQILFFALLPIWLKLTAYLHPVVLGVVWFCLTAYLLLIGLFISKKTVPLSKTALNGLTIFYSFGLLILLFFRPENQNYDSRTINLIPFRTIGTYLSGNFDFLISFYNLAANLGLFLPFGIY